MALLKVFMLMVSPFKYSRTANPMAGLMVLVKLSS